MQPIDISVIVLDINEDSDARDHDKFSVYAGDDSSINSHQGDEEDYGDYDPGQDRSPW